MPAGNKAPEAWVYMLRCRDGSLYTGWTNDLERRLARHQAGKGSRYTASRLPVELALELPMPDRSTARREEARIKRLSREAKLALLAEHKDLDQASQLLGTEGSTDTARGALEQTVRQARLKELTEWELPEDFPGQVAGMRETRQFVE
jgi:putative endonuclease